jgi:hypothetical protein
MWWLQTNSISTIKNKIVKPSANDVKWVGEMQVRGVRQMHELTAGKVPVAGLEPGSVAAEEAAEGRSAVILQPCPQQLHPLLWYTKELVRKQAGSNTCSFRSEEWGSHIADSGPIRVELLDDLFHVARGRHDRHRYGKQS